MKSYCPEVQTAGDGDRWSRNNLRFATKDEAEKYVRDLMWRWISVIDTRVVESDEPANYRWDNATGAQPLEQVKSDG